MIILFSFVAQAVSYEFQNKLGNLLGARTFQTMLVVNGVVGPLLLGMAVATLRYSRSLSSVIGQMLRVAWMLLPTLGMWY